MLLKSIDQQKHILGVNIFLLSYLMIPFAILRLLLLVFDMIDHMKDIIRRISNI